MNRLEFLSYLKRLGITENQFKRCVRTKAFKKKFKIRGIGFTHDYGEQEADAIMNVVLKKAAWEKAMRFE